MPRQVVSLPADLDWWQAPEVSRTQAEAERTPRKWAAWLQEHQRDELGRTARASLFAYARMHVDDVVSDAIADVVTGAFTKLPDTELEMVRFIKAVIRNKARHVNRRECRFTPFSIAQPLPALAVDPWGSAARAILMRDIGFALGHLTPRQRQVAVLHWQEGWRVHEIADRLGIADRTVKETLRRARSNLRSVLTSDDGCAAYEPPGGGQLNSFL